jgi:hypothetical protein
MFQRHVNKLSKKNCTPLVAQGIDVLIVTREVIDNTIIFVFKKAVLNLME